MIIEEYFPIPHVGNLAIAANPVIFPLKLPLKTLKVAWIPGGGVLPYMGYIGMCRCEGYGFQAVYSRIGYINQSVWV